MQTPSTTPADGCSETRAAGRPIPPSGEPSPRTVISPRASSCSRIEITVVRESPVTRASSVRLTLPCWRKAPTSVSTLLARSWLGAVMRRPPG